MSRTHRKSKFTEEKSLVSYINNEIRLHNRIIVHSVRRRKSDDVYSEEIRAEEHRFQIAMDEFKKKYKRIYGEEYISEETSRSFTRAPVKYYVARYYNVIVQETLDEVIENAIVEYKGYSRDNKFYESGNNKFYKHLCKKQIRSSNRMLMTKILKEEDDSNFVYLNDSDGKQFIWSVW
jgi:hypothetical protein